MNQPLQVSDFSGGKTDIYLAGPQNKGQEFDNLLINNNKKPFTRPGSDIDDLNNSIIQTRNKRISHMWNHRGQRMDQSERNIYYNNGTYNSLVGPDNNQAFASNTEANHISKAFWNNHSLLVSDSFCKPIKVFKDASNVFQVRTAGLPTITAPTVTAGGAGTNNYIYAFLYYVSYNVEGVTFEDFGPTVQVSLSNALAPDSSAVSISNIPAITNGSTDNYDVSNIKVKIYRSENDLTVLKYVGQVANGVTVYNDNSSDATITNSTTIYTTGDVVDNDTPPPAKFVHIANDIAMYAYVKEGGVEIPNRIRQSLKGDFDSCPADFLDDYPDEITGISSIQSTFIVFCTESIYRLDGFFDEQGRNGMVHQKISDTIGCVSNDSIIQSDNGLFFCGKEGWYYCDGFNVQKISNHLNDTYKQLVATTAQARNIFGAFDKNERRIWWCAQEKSNSLDNDKCYILDLNFGISAESTFTTASNEESFRPTCLLFKDNVMYRGDTRGFVFRHESTIYSDPKVDTNADASDWVRKTIVYEYKSCAFDFGTSFIRKFVPKVLLTLANLTNVAVSIHSINDDGRTDDELVELKYNSNIVWGDEDIVWGDASIIWNKKGLIEEKRHFPAGTLRCNYKQIRLTNSYTIIDNSDLLGTVSVDATTNKVTLEDASFRWPMAAVDYAISFENDDYATQFVVEARDSDGTLTLFDSGSRLVTGTGKKWLLRGYRKNEAVQILSYVIHYKMLTDSQKSYHGIDDSGENVPTPVVTP